MSITHIREYHCDCEGCSATIQVPDDGPRAAPGWVVLQSGTRGLEGGTTLALGVEQARSYTAICPGHVEEFGLDKLPWSEMPER